MAEFNLKDRMNEPAAEIKKEDRVFPLESGIKNQFEMIYAVDFSQVLIHLGAEADRMARDHGAAAVTQGSDIYFRSDQYNPHTQEGQKLLAHEMQHVQQFQSQMDMNANEDISKLEDSAEATERFISEVNLHSLAKPVLSDSSETGSDEIAINSSEASDETAIQSDASVSEESLDSFSGKAAQLSYRVYLESGKSYDFTPAEYEILLENLGEKLEEFLKEKEYQLNEDEYIHFVQKVTEMMEWGII